MPKQSEENDQTYATHTTRLHSEKKSDGTRCATSDGNKDFIDNLVYTTRLTQHTPQDFIQRRNRTEHAVQQ